MTVIAAWLLLSVGVVIGWAVRALLTERRDSEEWVAPVARIERARDCDDDGGPDAAA